VVFVGTCRAHDLVVVVVVAAVAAVVKVELPTNQAWIYSWVTFDVSFCGSSSAATTTHHYC